MDFDDIDAESIIQDKSDSNSIKETINKYKVNRKTRKSQTLIDSEKNMIIQKNDCKLKYGSAFAGGLKCEKNKTRLRSQSECMQINNGKWSMKNGVVRQRQMDNKLLDKD